MASEVILSHIVATSQNNVIGLNNKLPWHIPEDLKYFHNITKGKVLIMGRKTFQSLGKALPDRVHLVLTRNKTFKGHGAVVLSSFEEALRYSQQSYIVEKYGCEIFITGGGEIYKQTLLFMDRLYITRIHKNYEGDTFYPEIPKDRFQEIQRTDCKQPVPFSFIVYKKTHT